ncbi:MAG: hypothetical protein ACFFCY_02210 [Promethearchaeota archaeon]
MPSPTSVDDKIKRERAALYFDCICGASSAILSISCIIFFAITEGIPYPDRFSFGLTFWIIWLIFSLTLIGIGINQYYYEKHFDKKKQRKDIKAPIV